jgi:hypothetical protein
MMRQAAHLSFRKDSFFNWLNLRTMLPADKHKTKQKVRGLSHATFHRQRCRVLRLELR